MLFVNFLGWFIVIHPRSAVFSSTAVFSVGGSGVVRLLCSFYHESLRAQIIRNVNTLVIGTDMGTKSKVGA